MSEILTNTGVKLWSKDDYSELWLEVFEQLTGTCGKSNIRLLDESIGKLKTVKSIDDIDLMLEQIIKLLEA